MAAKEYTKHLVECKCVLPQFKQVEPPRWHHFVVFSEIDEMGSVIPSFAQCNNCGIVHRITEVGTSIILTKDNSTTLPSLEELKIGLPDKIVSILEKYDVDLPTYQEAMFIFEHKLWGRTIILNKEILDGLLVGKYLVVLGDSLWKINSFEQEAEND
jgi:hypothetical protein